MLIANNNTFASPLLGISPFIVALIKELSFDRVPSGGAGNKMLMLLEGKGAAYIQDRGVSRWGKLDLVSIALHQYLNIRIECKCC